MSLHLVSIPSNGSIQFLLSLSGPFSFGAWGESQSPQTGQFNSYRDGLKAFANYRNFESQSPQTGQFNSYRDGLKAFANYRNFESQSPQTGQFNSYRYYALLSISRVSRVSIPSNGSIQFLHDQWEKYLGYEVRDSLNPLKRVNSILTIFMLS